MLIIFTILFKKEKLFPKLFRIVSFALILGFIFEPLFEFLVLQKSWLLVLIDTSKSMRVGERLEKVKEILPKIKLRNKVYGFNAHPYLIQDSIVLEGNETNIANAFIETPTPSAYLLLSDGINNSGPDPIKIAQHNNIPVYTVKIDSIPRDICITSIEYNKIAYTEDRIPIKIRFKNLGHKPQKIKVLLKEENRILRKKETYLPKKGAEKEIRFWITPSIPGIHLYEVVIPTLPGELFDENNHMTFGIHILKSRVKVAWFASMPSWNFKFAKLELENNPQIDFNWWIKIGSQKWLSKTGVSDSPDFKTKYNILILEDFKYPGIERLVDKGIRLILLGKTCKDLSPFVFGFSGSWNKSISRRVKIESSFNIFPAYQGLVSGKESQLPLLKEIYDVRGVKGGVKVLARIQSLSADPSAIRRAGRQDIPLIATINYGKGLILGIAAKDIWRWNFLSRQDSACGEIGVKFWNNLIKFMMLLEELSALWVETNNIHQVGERMLFKVQAYTKDYRPDPASQITLKVWSKFSLKSGLQVKKSIPLHSIGNGKYEGIIDFLPPAEYKYQAVTQTEESVQGVFLVTSSLESQDFAPNQELLQGISRASGGQYAEDFKNLDIKLKPRKFKLYFLPTHFSLFLILIIILLSIEWFILRK